MTCIVAKVQDGRVWMAGDQEGSDSFRYKEYPNNPKVFWNEDFMIGYTSSYRMAQILQYSWEPPSRIEGVSDDKYLYKSVIDSIKKCFEDNGFGHKDGTEFSSGNFLLGWKGRLFEFEGNLQILEHLDFASVGCGCYHAYAAMKAMYKFEVYKDSPQDFLAEALDIASDCVSGVGKTYTVIYELGEETK